ncbi:MAG TPA: response regulator, partial [Longimicrobium sp.]|nr:response regulator [Longimicrobium sp.]
METIRVLIVEDHLLLAAGLGAILGAVPGMSVAGEAASADQAGERAEEVRPDIAVVSLALRGGAGLDAVRRCRHAGARVLA